MAVEFKDLEALLDTSTLEGRFRMLEYLGTSDSIAEFFRYKGIAGYPQTTGECPVSLYLSDDKRGRVLVRPICCDLCESYVADYASGLSRELDRGTNRFVKDFDNHRYPDLEH